MSATEPTPVPGARAFIRVTFRADQDAWLDAERISTVRDYAGLSDQLRSTITVGPHTFHAVDNVDDVMARIMQVHHLQATGEAL